MAAPRRHPCSRTDASADQLTLADWERAQAHDAMRRAETVPSQPPSASAPPVEIEPLAAALAPRIAAELATQTPAAPTDCGTTARLLTLDELVAELPPAKRPETWKRWLYERTRRGEIPGCVKLGGMLFFQRESAVAWLRAGMTATK
jgi:hypothetical protein